LSNFAVKLDEPNCGAAMPLWSAVCHQFVNIFRDFCLVRKIFVHLIWQLNLTWGT